MQTQRYLLNSFFYSDVDMKMFALNMFFFLLINLSFAPNFSGIKVCDQTPPNKLYFLVVCVICQYTVRLSSVVRNSLSLSDTRQTTVECEICKDLIGAFDIHTFLSFRSENFISLKWYFYLNGWSFLFLTFVIH